MDVSPFPVNHSRQTDDHPSTAWSAPSAIGLAGVGVGGQAGAEMTDFLVVLNSRSVGHPLNPVYDAD
jgi:lipid-binding SYLF domain-containing protein